jgi:hypothetical protein
MCVSHLFDADKGVWRDVVLDAQPDPIANYYFDEAHKIPPRISFDVSRSPFLDRYSKSTA